MPDQQLESFRSGDAFADLRDELQSGALDFAGVFIASEDVPSPSNALTGDEWHCTECLFPFDGGFRAAITIINDDERRVPFCSPLCADARGFHLAATVWRESVQLGQGWEIVVNRNGRRLYPGESLVEPAETPA